MIRTLQLLNLEGCCQGKIAKGFGGDSDEPKPKPDRDVKSLLYHTNITRNPERGFTLAVLSKKQLRHFRKLFDEAGFQRISVWMMPERGQNATAVFMCRHDNTYNTKINNRAKGKRL